MFPPDINVWLALGFDAKSEHTKALQRFSRLTNQSCVFVRFTQQGFLRLATNASAVGPQVCSQDQARALYDALRGDRRVGYAHEPEGLETHWRAYAGGTRSEPKLWSDAYLAAFAAANNWTLVTFDRGFSQFPGLKCLIL